MSVFRALQQLGAWLERMHQLMRVIAAELQPGRHCNVLYSCLTRTLLLPNSFSLSPFPSLSYFYPSLFVPFLLFPTSAFLFLPLILSFKLNFKLAIGIFSLQDIFKSLIFDFDLPSHSLTHHSLRLSSFYRVFTSRKCNSFFYSYLSRSLSFSTPYMTLFFLQGINLVVYVTPVACNDSSHTCVETHWFTT